MTSRGYPHDGNPSHPGTEPRWNSKVSEELEQDHWEAGGLYRYLPKIKHTLKCSMLTKVTK